MPYFHQRIPMDLHLYGFIPTGEKIDEEIVAEIEL
jgi:hypothetical protein